MSNINFDEYTVVQHKINKQYFVVKKSDTPNKNWNDLLDEKIMCYPFKDNYLTIGEREYYRNELDITWVEFN